jgi:hypothetical protein
VAGGIGLIVCGFLEIFNPSNAFDKCEGVLADAVQCKRGYEIAFILNKVMCGDILSPIGCNQFFNETYVR